ncbi:hypothetical protein MMC21_003219 [Puttea exsequens]|nr:hypothetical protein [Puttea exsequens]
MATPTDAPPPYSEAAPSSSSSRPTPGTQPSTRNGIPPHTRRSMEDEGRALPKGWLRSYDPDNAHQFFVDTTADPPRSIWHHPYDDDDYMNSLAPDERAHIRGLHRVPTQADIAAESSDSDDATSAPPTSKPKAKPAAVVNPADTTPTTLPPRPTADSNPAGLSKWGRRMKDRLTHSTHTEREHTRALRAEEEQRTYARHLEYRRAMTRAAQTGTPQFLGRDPHTGKDVYIEPPPQMMMGGAGGGRGGYGGGHPPGAYGYNPYQQGPYAGGGGGRPDGGSGAGVYADPNATFIRPAYARPVGPYSRPYGGGFGGGMGLPIAGGLLGGLLLGDLMF